MLTRKTALFLLLSNMALLAYIIGGMIFFHQSFINNFNQFPFLTTSTWVMLELVGDIPLIIVFWGCIKVLIAARERSFMVWGTTIFIIAKLLPNFIGILIATRKIDIQNPIADVAEILQYVFLAAFMVSVFLIRSTFIKRYFIGFAALLVAGEVLRWLTRYLFRLFEWEWVLINVTVLNMVPFFVTLALFYKLYKSSAQQIAE